MEQLRDFVSYFENSALADNIRENDVLFPLIESLHVVSICLVVGSIFAVDLRLLGLASTDRPVSRVTNGILPLTWTAFAVAVASGSLLFISNATKYLGNGYFDAKILLICAAGLNMAMFHVIGCDTTVMLGAQAGQLQLNVMMPIIAHNLFEMMHVTIGAVKAFTEKCVLGLEAQPDKAATWLAKNPILVTALNPIIGYNKGAEVAKKSMKDNKSVLDVVVELKYMSEADAKAALDARQMTEGGLVEGSTGGG